MVDASVALALVWQERSTPSAERFFAPVHKGWSQLMAPGFWLIECANGCWKRVKRQACTPEEAGGRFNIIRSLPVQQIDIEIVADVVLEIALETRTTSYDALYVATAQFADVPLVTADGRLVQALSDARWPGRAMHISQW